MINTCGLMNIPKGTKYGSGGIGLKVHYDNSELSLRLVHNQDCTIKNGNLLITSTEKISLPDSINISHFSIYSTSKLSTTGPVQISIKDLNTKQLLAFIIIDQKTAIESIVLKPDCAVLQYDLNNTKLLVEIESVCSLDDQCCKVPNFTFSPSSRTVEILCPTTTTTTSTTTTSTTLAPDLSNIVYDINDVYNPLNIRRSNFGNSDNIRRSHGAFSIVAALPDSPTVSFNNLFSAGLQSYVKFNVKIKYKNNLVFDFGSYTFSRENCDIIHNKIEVSLLLYNQYFVPCGMIYRKEINQIFSFINFINSHNIEELPINNATIEITNVEFVNMSQNYLFFTPQLIWSVLSNPSDIYQYSASDKFTLSEISYCNIINEYPLTVDSIFARIEDSRTTIINFSGPENCGLEYCNNPDYSQIFESVPPNYFVFKIDIKNDPRNLGLNFKFQLGSVIINSKQSGSSSGAIFLKTVENDIITSCIIAIDKCLLPLNEKYFYFTNYNNGVICEISNGKNSSKKVTTISNFPASREIDIINVYFDVPSECDGDGSLIPLIPIETYTEIDNLIDINYRTLAGMTEILLLQNNKISGLFLEADNLNPSFSLNHPSSQGSRFYKISDNNFTVSSNPPILLNFNTTSLVPATLAIPNIQYPNLTQPYSPIYPVVGCPNSYVAVFGYIGSSFYFSNDSFQNVILKLPPHYLYSSTQTVNIYPNSIPNTFTACIFSGNAFTANGFTAYINFNTSEILSSFTTNNIANLNSISKPFSRNTGVKDIYSHNNKLYVALNYELFNQNQGYNSILVVNEHMIPWRDDNIDCGRTHILPWEEFYTLDPNFLEKRINIEQLNLPQYIKDNFIIQNIVFDDSRNLIYTAGSLDVNCSTGGLLLIISNDSDEIISYSLLPNAPQKIVLNTDNYQQLYILYTNGFTIKNL